MMDKWRISTWILFCLMAVFLFVFLQREFMYHFYFAEQNFMFLASAQYLKAHLALPGGFADMSGEFLVRYFMFPYAGAAITTVLVSLTAVFTALILRRVNPGYNWLILSCAPALCLLFMHFDFNYKPGGTVAFLFVLLFLLVATYIRKDLFRLIYNFAAVCALFWLCGSACVLYVLLVLCYEFIGKKPLRYHSLVLVLPGGLLGALSLQFALLGEYRFAFLPDMFYHNRLQPKMHIYFSWISLVALFVFALMLKPAKDQKTLRHIAGLALPLALVLLFAVWGVRRYGDQKAAKVKELDYYVRTGQWDEIVEASRGKLTNYLNICYLNMALAEKGMLADNMFLYDQRGVDGLLLKWNRTFSVSVMLSDLYFTIGNVAVAQEMAFEAYVSAMGEGNPRMLKRLVQTNLIYGEYKVAEKYIDLLEKTAYYRDWARDHRRFLNNDKAVGEDPLLGEKRRGLLVDSYLSNSYETPRDLAIMAEAYLANKTPVEYLGALLLLSKDMEGFQALLDKYYGTEVLPSLPAGFQEAVIILNEKIPEKWVEYNVKESVIEHFGRYRKAILANKNSQSLPQLMARDYGNTYWFYFMFK